VKVYQLRSDLSSALAEISIIDTESKYATRRKVFEAFGCGWLRLVACFSGHLRKKVATRFDDRGITTLPLPDGPAACQIVQYYTLRWRIERLHYTIKTGGCNAEQLHLDDAKSILLALALYYVAAWRLLYIYYYARTQPNISPKDVFRSLELEVLE